MAGRRRYRSSVPWAEARQALREALLSEAPRADVEVGFIKRLGEGLSRQAFWADVEVRPDPTDLSGPYVVLLPGRDAGEEVVAAMGREARLLRHLSRLNLPFRVPRPVGEVQDDQGRIALVETLVGGLPLDFRSSLIKPWEVVGSVAAAIHTLDPAPLRNIVPGHGTRRDHVLAAMASSSDGLDHPLIQGVRQWIGERLPPNEPTVLLHGDLLGQNILLPLLDPDKRPHLIDWGEAALGDPAYDFRPPDMPCQLSGTLGSSNIITQP